MKKRIIISTFLIMICLLTGNCYARAGGGSGSEIGGNLIVNIKDARVAIGKDMANKIMVG